MSEKNPIRVFVSHVFSESDDYLRVFEYLESVDNFFYVNCSKPENVPKGAGEAFKEELLAQIKEAEVVVVLGSLHAKKRDWIDYQMQVAKANSLPVVSINSFGATAVMSQSLMEASDDVLDWNAREIVDSIKRKARNEDTNRWDVIDFP